MGDQLQDKPSAVDVALEEYRQLWNYYKITLDERRHLFEYYFRTVTLPAGLTGLVALVVQSPTVGIPAVSGVHTVVFVVLLAIYLVGYNIHAVYTKESSNAKKYETALRDIRSYLNSAYPDLKPVITIDRLRSEASGFYALGSTKFWRGMLIPIINSFIAAFALVVVMKQLHSLLFAAVFIGSILLHVVGAGVVNVVYSRHA